ncbi:MAG: type II secretion protein [Thermoproteus sp.]|nr:type II secretion protein [Thermoproteus sp.]
MRTKFAVVYSVDGGVGKTTLATALSFEKERILLVDADWEKADASALFGVPKRPGWLAGYYGKDVYLHRMKPNLYVVPGYEAAALYQQGKISDYELFEALTAALEAVPDAIAEERLPVDTVVVDTPKALQLSWLEALQRKFRALMFFMADRRLVMRLIDPKADIYQKYTRYATLVLANMLEKGDEKAPGIKMVNAYLTRVKMPNEYAAEKVYKAVISDRKNRDVLRLLVQTIKEK